MYKSMSGKKEAVFYSVILAGWVAIFLYAAYSPNVSAQKMTFVALDSAFVILVLSLPIRLHWVLCGVLAGVVGIEFVSVVETGDFLSTLALSNAEEYSALGLPAVLRATSLFAAFVALMMATHYVARRTLKSTWAWLVVFPGYLLASVFVSTSSLYAFASISYHLYEERTFSPMARLDDRARSFVRDDFWHADQLSPIDIGGKSVIVIFAEGISSRVIDTYNGKGLLLTPHIDEFLKKSVRFENYFNHTAATFRGLRGQLTSFYQYRDGHHPDKQTGIEDDMTFEDVDREFKGRLVSVPKILNENGYETYFLSSTEVVSKLNRMLASLDFTKVFGMGDFYDDDARMSDKQTFAALRKLVEDKVAGGRKKVFIGVYPSGTHHGKDSLDAQYGDGSNSYYNKFYNLDVQFGEFFEWFEKSPISENTILILTTDHATFPAPQFQESLGRGTDYFVDRIPLAIYGRYLAPQSIDARNMNSLAFAPTLMHMLGIQKRQNMFLGCSIFDRKCSGVFDRISAIGGDIFDTSSGNTVHLYDSLEFEKMRNKAQVTYDIGG